jgi:integrase
MVLQVRTSASREVMMRTVFLDDFSSAYLAVERREICHDLLPPLFLTTADKDGVQKNAPVSARRRRSKVEAGLRAYVRYLGVKSAEVPFAAMVAAAAQWIMLNSTPMVASYARGELDTTDLGDAEIRRLGGLNPLRRGSAVPDEAQFPVTQQLDLGDADLPADLLARVPVMRALGRHSSPHKSEWRRIIHQYKPTSAVERLLCSFALWLLDHSDPRAATESRISAHRKRHLAARIKIVAYALLGYVAGGSERVLLDADALASLQEASREEFPDRLQHGAWFHFYAFRKDGDADHAGFEVGKLGPPPERAVSAKILTADELDALHSLLWSARSGIGNPALRISAQRHVELMTAYGLRRAESAYLRSVDFQQDAARVQAYGQHSLKTPWADRVLPIEFADPSTRTWVRKATDGHFEKLIDPDAKTTVHPDNFFDALSRLVKAVTQDDSMGSHHLRHTLISRLVLTLLRDSTGLDALDDDLPWLRGLILDREHMQALLGAEGDAGQGVRAVSALVGHSHPTTTIRHYVHVLGIGLYGTLRKVDTLDMSRSFENRLGGKSTIQRWAARARLDVAAVSDVGERRQRINRVLRDRIECRFHNTGIDRDETPRPSFAFSVDDSGPDDESAEITFDKLELVDRSLRDGGAWLDPANIAVYQRGLARLASVLTGRRGSSLSRHVLTEEREGVWLPRVVSAGIATRAAVVLCKWLESLRVHRPEDFQWLLIKWVGASARERGRGRVDTAAEVERARGLGDARLVEVRIERAFVSKKRMSQGVKRVPRLRIKCLDGSRKPMMRATIATRWVMSYVAARWHRW